jgi:hypothetical protein
VIAGVALGGEPQDAGPILSHLPDVAFGLLEPLEHVAGRRQEPLASRRQHQPFADPEEERRAKPRLDVAQLVAEG